MIGKACGGGHSACNSWVSNNNKNIKNKTHPFCQGQFHSIIDFFHHTLPYVVPLSFSFIMSMRLCRALTVPVAEGDSLGDGLC